MKRKLILISVAICCVLLCVLALTACNNNKTDEPKNNISRQTDEYYAGESELFAVSIENGKRERAFIADGVATDVSDFCELIIVPLKTNDYETISYVIFGENESKLIGEIKHSDMGGFTTSIALDFVPKTITVTAGSDVSEIELADVLEGALSSNDVINIAKDALKDKLDEEYSQGKADREIYVKLITADRTNYYYYVSFIGDGVDYWAMLIDVKSGEIVSRK